MHCEAYLAASCLKTCLDQMRLYEYQERFLVCFLFDVNHVLDISE